MLGPSESVAISQYYRVSVLIHAWLKRLLLQENQPGCVSRSKLIFLNFKTAVYFETQFLEGKKKKVIDL